MNIEAQAVFKFMAWAQINAKGIFAQEYLAFFDKLPDISITSRDDLILEYKKSHQPRANSGIYWESSAPARVFDFRNKDV